MEINGKKNKHRMDEMGMVMLFAGVQKDDPTKLHAIMKFPDMEAFQAFGSNEELTEERKKAGFYAALKQPPPLP